MNLILRNISDLSPAAPKIIGAAGSSRIIAFYGQMGAGKTTIIKALCAYLGANDLVSSPTFTLINEYLTNKGESIYHIDFYRIRKAEEIFDFGIEEYFSSGSMCFLEWPELVEEYLPSDVFRIKITLGGNEERILTFQ